MKTPTMVDVSETLDFIAKKRVCPDCAIKILLGSAAVLIAANGLDSNEYVSGLAYLLSDESDGEALH